ncbi:hypothetical protein Mmc1_3533 [Magnetococcus marinus MC-1]|uniref:STAS domain-containing protein n=1 Tax=Magnetococcus marinus (strain ATCC BAA-1437 / JCM 17883 / MC-1) TaxID=156889 RepID=A0LDH5_MAGMM|nr:STAS domain-containing protein [Magnetococcus marinus]ABK46018.1 hypothetical protein Mmc1_3533 [Magnetococcus marinus MC-1]
MQNRRPIQIVQQNNGTFIKPPQRFEVSCHNEFLRAIEPLAQVPLYLVDLTETSYIDSAGLGMLLLLRQRFCSDTARVELHIIPGHVQKVLAISRFDQLFTLVMHEQPIVHDPETLAMPLLQSAGLY